MPQLPFSFRDQVRPPQDESPRPDRSPGAPTSEVPEAPNRPRPRPSKASPELPDKPEIPKKHEAPKKHETPKKDETPRIFSVSELQRTLRLRLEAEFPPLSVRAEVSNLRIQSSGHAYFTLKDRRAQLRCVLFAQERRQLPFRLEDGLLVVATGRITIYDRTGNLQMRVLRCQVEGEGALWIQFQERAKKLRDEGLTADARKKPLPNHPQRVGVVTSRTGAALRDIVRTLIQRAPSVHIRLSHAMVQGSRAAGDIVAAIRNLDRFGDCDLLIVARGGGSLEDLWAFNEEPVARAIAACRVPVVVGVGHETDVTLADMVADRSASTPTAAAAAAVPDTVELSRRMATLENRLARAARQRREALRHQLQARTARLDRHRPPLHRWAQQLDHLGYRADTAAQARIRAEQKRLRALTQRLENAAPAARLAAVRERLHGFPERMARAMQARLTESRAALADVGRRLPAVQRTVHDGHARLARHAGQLEALSPLAVLNRGYALVQSDQRVIRNAQEVQPGDEVDVQVAEGSFRARVLG